MVEETVLVTGGCGLVGLRAVAALKAAGHSVRVLDLHRADFARAEALGARCISGSVVDGESVRKALGASRAVIHLAGPDARIADKAFMRKMVVAGAEVLMEEVDGSDVEVVVAASTAGVYARSPTTADESAPIKVHNELERAKLDMEGALAKGARRAGVRAAALRMGLVYARGDGCVVDLLVERMREPRPLPLPRNGYVNVVHADDAAAAAIGLAKLRRRLEKGRCDVLNCASGEVLPVEGFLRALALAAGVRAGPPPLRPGFLARGPDAWMRARDRTVRIVDAAPVSIGRIRTRLTEWPRWPSFERGLADAVSASGATTAPSTGPPPSLPPMR